MYQSLLEMERKLDWTMTRKKVEVQDTLARNPTVRKKWILQHVTQLLRFGRRHGRSGSFWAIRFLVNHGK